MLFVRLPSQSCVVVLSGLLLGACSGEITTGSPSTGNGGAGNGGTLVTGGTGGSIEVLEPGAFSTGPGLRRLTRTEYAYTVEDLLGFKAERSTLPAELIVQSHGFIAGAQKIGYEDNEKYYTVADKAATFAAPKLLSTLNCQTPACYSDFARAFLLKAFRAPPDDASVAIYAGILQDTKAGDTVSERLETFLTVVLTSPHFLYRKELGTTVSGRSRKLSDDEIASRLSYLVWQSAPDTALFEAAASNALATPARRLVELQRMLKDPRAARGLRTFSSDWMALFRNAIPEKVPAVLQNTDATFANSAERGFELLVDEVLTADGASFTDLLTADHVMGDAAVAKVLGLNYSGTGFIRLPLDTTSHRGVLTHPMVIGAHSKEGGASPFPIGKFIYENILCEVIPPPPAVFPNIEDVPDGLSLRQRLEAMTKDAPCSSCHTRIGPPGFAFLPFDPIARFSRNDASGKPFDTTGTLLLPDETKMPFDGAADLANKLAAQPSVQACIATRLFRFTQGRFESDADSGELATITDSARKNTSDVAQLLTALVGGKTFSEVLVK
ncbi:MAG: DUF1592 domain-containing protein [Deltaproteobacteria bacterium]|nr:DUF1592 domain-containing protein [Deltaproteobacteria bacterium]